LTEQLAASRDRNVSPGFNGTAQRGHHVRARCWLAGGAVKAVSPARVGAKRRPLTA
jgi:hypothetical protein